MKSLNFIIGFSFLGIDLNTSDNIMKLAEMYVCALNGRSEMKYVDEVKSTIFWTKYNDDNKVLEICSLALSHKNLCLHLKRSNYVSYIFKYVDLLEIEREASTLHDWIDNSVELTSDYFHLTLLKFFLGREGH